MNALDIAVDFVRRAKPRHHPFNLTERQWQVARLLRRGMTCTDIAVHLQVTPSVIRRHRDRIRHKIGAPDRQTVTACLARIPGLTPFEGEIVDIDDFRIAFGPARPAWPPLGAEEDRDRR